MYIGKEMYIGKGFIILICSYLMVIVLICFLNVYIMFLLILLFFYNVEVYMVIC